MIAEELEAKCIFAGYILKILRGHCATAAFTAVNRV